VWLKSNFLLLNKTVAVDAEEKAKEQQFFSIVRSRTSFYPYRKSIKKTLAHFKQGPLTQTNKHKNYFLRFKYKHMYFFIKTQ